MKYILVFLLLSGYIMPCSSQSLEQALAGMPLKDKVALFMDILMKQPELFDTLQNVLLAAMPVISSIHLNPPLDQYLMPWALQEIPVLLKSTELGEMVKVLVEEVNGVNITGLDVHNATTFLQEFFDRFDLLHVGIREVDVLLEPVFTSRNLSHQYYKIVIPYVMSLLEEFLNLYGEKILGVVIKEINSVNTTGLFHTNTSSSILRSARTVASAQTGSSSQHDSLVFLSRIDISKMIKQSLAQMAPSIGKILVDYGLKPELVAPVLRGSIDLADSLIKTRLPGLLRDTIQAMNNVKYTKNDTLNPDSFFEKLTSPVVPKLMEDVANSVDILTMGKQFLLQKNAKQYFPKTLKDKSLTDECYNDTMYFIDSLLGHIEKFQPNMSWSIKMLDAFGKPTTGILRGHLNFVGSYDQCMSLKYSMVDGANNREFLSGRYCRATIGLPQSMKSMVDVLIGKIDTHGVPLTLTWGFCLPDTCHKDDVKDILHLGPLRSFNITPMSVVCEEDHDLPHDSDAIIVICVISVMVGIVLLATFIHMFTKERDDEVELRAYSPEVNRAYDEEMTEIGNGNAGVSMNGKVKENGHVNDYDSLKSVQPETKYEGGVLKRLIKSFSICHNVPSVLSFERYDHDISCIDGIRVMSIAWIILGNSVLYTTLSISDSPVTANLLDALKYQSMFTFQAVLSAPYAMDTFLLISGCLIAYRSLTKAANDKLNTFGASVGLVLHKYIRLTPVYIIVMVIYVCLYTYVGSGPMWPEKMAVADKCKANWWHHILYVNNLIDTTGNTPFEQCMPWSWFLACLMQFYLITPILLIFFSMSYRLGIVLVLLLMSAGIVATGVKQHNYGGSVLTSYEDHGDYWNNVFITPWCRVAAYCVGLLLGYVLFLKKKIKMNVIVATVGWIVAIGVFDALVYSQYSQNKPDGHKWTDVQSAVYEAIGRPLWAAAVAWVILACHNGRGGFINSILSWNGFLPLSRLTYVAYLVHPVIMVTFVYSKRTLYYMNNLEMIYLFLGHILTSFGAAFILSLVFEMPFLGLEKAVKSKKWRK